HRVPGRLPRRHARRTGRRAGQLQASPRQRALHRPRCGGEPDLRRCRAPPRVPGRSARHRAGERRPRWARRLRRPGAVRGGAPVEIAMILYTSGSTGRPKGVLLSHAGQLWAIRQRIDTTPELERHRFMVAAPFYHMNALCTAKLVLAAHASMVLLPQFRAPAFIGAIARYRATWLSGVPTMLALLARETDLLARSDLTSVERVAVGSAPLAQALIDTVKEIFPGALVSNGYGTT